MNQTSYTLNNALRPTGQWSDGGQMTAQYSSASAQYSQASYNTSTHHHGVPGQPTSGSMYAAPPMHQGAMQGNYHSGASSYPPDAGRLTSAAMSQQAYSSPSQAYPEQQAYSSSHIPRQQHSHPHHHHHHSQPYPIPQPMGPPPMMGHVDPAGQYPSQMAYRQATPLSSQHPDYPASPSRPFCCDLCALSFNRMHDLKRHRETHTGEKPYLCNGGCGKTFTRKDALKRHQLVKQCGKDDEA